jgi:hypothetical protein
VRPRTVLTVVGLLVLAIAGLVLLRDSGDEQPEGERPAGARTTAEPGPRGPDPSVDDGALHSAQRLAGGFERVTGDRLELEPDEFFTTASFADRTLDEGRQADAYYGNFLLFVYPSAAAARAAARRDGRWSSYGSGYYGQVAVGNVVVQTTSERRRTDAAWARLLRAVRAARGTAPSAAALPAAERLCTRRGIRLDSGPTGTCKRGPQLFSIQHRARALRLPGIAIEDVRVSRGPRFGTRGRLVDRAKGVFVELRFRVRNTGRAAIETRPGYELVVGGRRFEEHTAIYGLRDRYPLRPGEEDGDVTLFDVPAELAGRALQRAGLQVPGNPASSFGVSEGLRVGHLRLTGPVARLRVRPEPEPEPLPPLPPPTEPEPPPEPGPGRELTPVTPA